MSKFGDLDIPPPPGGSGPIVMGWHTTEEPYFCCMCGVQEEHPRLRGPGFFRVAEDKKLKPLCFDCVTGIGDPITNDQNLGNLVGLRILFKLAERIRVSKGADLTLGELTDWFKILARLMTENPDQV